MLSPTNSKYRKSYHQQNQHQSPLVISNKQILSNSATKRTLDLNSLIDRTPDTETTSNQFKAPLTEHQKEVKKSKSNRRI